MNINSVKRQLDAKLPLTVFGAELLFVSLQILIFAWSVWWVFKEMTKKLPSTSGVRNYKYTDFGMRNIRQ